jgi:capsular polysaccharide biosynthesis protein
LITKLVIMEKTIVDVTLPLNLTDDDKHLFIPKTQYALNPLNVKMLNNVFVAYTGYCLDENMVLVKESHHDYPEQLPEYMGEVEAHYQIAAENPELLITLDDDNTYLLIHHPWFNYYHWLTEAIPRLWLVKDSIHTMVLILPDFFKSNEWMRSSLAPFTFKDIFYIPTGKELWVKNLCIPQIKPICASYNRMVLKEMRDLYLHHVSEKKEHQINLGDKLYISRQKAAIRKFKNESDVEVVLKKYGFTILCCEDYSFLDQLSIFSNARYLVSIHGAGLTNMLFMKPQARALELHKKITNRNDHHSLIYWYMASALDHDYYHQICLPVNNKANFFKADMIVDIDVLEENLQKMLIPKDVPLVL